MGFGTLNIVIYYYTIGSINPIVECHTINYYKQ